MIKIINLAFCIVLLMFSNVINAQTFEEYKKEQARKKAEFAKQQQKGMDNLAKEYKDYVQKRNLEYAKFLKGEWEERETQPENNFYEDTKPDEIPYIAPQPDDERKEDRIIPINPIVIEQVEVPKLPERKAPSSVDLPIEEDKAELIKIDFYGIYLEIPVDKDFKNIVSKGISEENVADWLTKVANTNHLPSSTFIDEYINETGLNDWGRYIITKKLAERLTFDKTSQTLYTWFLILQSDYDVRLARQSNKIHLLIPFYQRLYEVPYLTIGEKDFYMIGDTDDEGIFTYNHQNNDINRSFDLNFSKAPKVAEKGHSTFLNFSYDDKEFSLELEYDPVLVQMLRYQPQPYITTYFSSKASVFLEESANKAITKLLLEMDEHDAVNLLLRMVQTAFAYKTDIEHFGKQKFMYPDEVVYHPFTDCDDRAVLFAWLVRNYTQQKVAALLYPGHLSAAVHFPQGNPQGDRLKLNYKEFVVSDPTYINANIGQTMPQFKNVNPEGWVVY